jgi:hypothetical protein
MKPWIARLFLRSLSNARSSRKKPISRRKLSVQQLESHEAPGSILGDGLPDPLDLTQPGQTAPPTTTSGTAATTNGGTTYPSDPGSTHTTLSDTTTPPPPTTTTPSDPGEIPPSVSPTPVEPTPPPTSGGGGSGSTGGTTPTTPPSEPGGTTPPPVTPPPPSDGGTAPAPGSGTTTPPPTTSPAPSGTQPPPSTGEGGSTVTPPSSPPPPTVGPTTGGEGGTGSPPPAGTPGPTGGGTGTSPGSTGGTVGTTPGGEGTGGTTGGAGGTSSGTGGTGGTGGTTGGESGTGGTTGGTGGETGGTGSGSSGGATGGGTGGQGTGGAGSTGGSNGGETGGSGTGSGSGTVGGGGGSTGSGTGGEGGTTGGTGGTGGSGNLGGTGGSGGSSGGAEGGSGGTGGETGGGESGGSTGGTGGGSGETGGESGGFGTGTEGGTGGSSTGGETGGTSGGTGSSSGSTGSSAAAPVIVHTHESRSLPDWNVTISNTGSNDLAVTSDGGGVTLSAVQVVYPWGANPINAGAYIYGLTGETPTVNWSGPADWLTLTSTGEVTGMSATVWLSVTAKKVTGAFAATDPTGILAVTSQAAIDLATTSLSAGKEVYATSADTVRGTVRPVAARVTIEGTNGVDLTVSGSQFLSAKAQQGDIKVGSAGDLNGAELWLTAGGKVDVDATGNAQLSVSALGALNVHLTGDLDVLWLSGKDTTIQAKNVRTGHMPDPSSPGNTIPAGGSIGSSGTLVLDVAEDIQMYSVGARGNLWVAARDGSAGAVFTSYDGWAYVWASQDVQGYVTAMRSASVTAFGDLNAAVTSYQDDVEVYTGGDLRKYIQAGRDLTVDAVGSVNGSLRGRDVTVSAGGDLTKDVESFGTADLSIGGNLTASFVTASASLDVTVNGDIAGSDDTAIPLLSAGDDATVWAGGKISHNVNGASADVTAVGPISGNVKALKYDATVWTGDILTGKVKAEGNAVIEAVGDVNSQIDGGPGVSVVSNGAIAGSAVADWVVDLRAATTAGGATVSTRKNQADWVAREDSPRNIRLAVLDAEIAGREQTLPSLAGNPDYDAMLQELEALRSERSILAGQVPSITDASTSYVRTDRVRDLINAGEGQFLNEEIDGRSVYGYVAVSDLVGGNFVRLVLKPVMTVPVYAPTGYPTPPQQTGTQDASLVGQPDWLTRAESFKVVLRQETTPVGTAEQAADRLVNVLRTPDSVRTLFGTVVAQEQAAQIELLQQGIEFGVAMVPIVSTADHLAKGEYWEAGISFVGDIATITGVGAGLSAVIKGRKCVVAGQKVLKLARVAQVAAVADGSLSAARIGQGLYALGKGDKAAAWGYFGDATLRLFGLAGAVKHLRTKPKCFVAGTPVHAADGLKPIEDIRAGDRVWAFDRQRQEWALCPVERTFQRTSDLLVTARLSDGTELTGTDGHPVWVIEGEALTTRPHGDHGADEPDGPTPGRWVALAGVRAGDVVLTRLGRVARVMSAKVRAEAVPVFNFQVAGLHSYAVGSGGVLVHNAPDPYLEMQEKVVEAATKPHGPDAPTGTHVTPDTTAPHPPESLPTKAPPAGNRKPAVVEAPTPNWQANPGPNVPKEFTRKPSIPTEGKGGRWLDDRGNPGIPGESFWVSDNGAIRIKYEGQFPKFEAVNGAEFKIDAMLGDRKKDFSAANQKLMDRLRTDAAFRQQFGVDENWIQSMTASDGKTIINEKMNKWLSNTDRTWHHKEDMQTMQLVPKDVHNVARGGLSHTGGASYAQGTLKKLKDLGLVTEQQMKDGLTPALIDTAKQNGIIPSTFPI